MNVRRAEYSEGAGLLAVGDGRLLFVESAEHQAVSQLREAARSTRPLRALAAVLASAEFDVPPFVYVEAGDDVGDGLKSIVCGQIHLEIQDTKKWVVDGTSAEPWAHAHSSADASVAFGCGSGEIGDLWIESGVVRASAFRWSCHEAAPSSLAAAPAAGRLAAHEVEPAGEPAGQDQTEAGSMVFAVDEHELAETAPVRMVNALVCLGCGGFNPPMSARCRSCDSLLSEINSEIRSVAQPVLGVIHLSDERSEPVDADLLIGRNPRRFGIKPHQRAVVHGVGDQSVSRLHLELKLDEWSVTATNLKRGVGTTIETRLGGRAKLASGVPHQLNDGDTIHFGRAWLTYEECTLSPCSDRDASNQGST